MADEPQSALRAIMGNRLFQVLAVIMALLTIYIQGMEAWKVTSDARKAAAEATEKNTNATDVMPNYRDRLTKRRP